MEKIKYIDSHPKQKKSNSNINKRLNIIVRFGIVYRVLCYGTGKMKVKKIVFNKIDPNLYPDVVIIVMIDVRFRIILNFPSDVQN